VKRLAFLLLLVALVAGACGGSDNDEPNRAAAPAPAEPTLTDLTTVDQLRERFNADRGVPRLIVLVAPT
jgi:ABC-type glycerol-3-phosphate transport system substrate-binding protein